MSSFDQNEDVAKELADEQRQASIAEFFEKNKQMLGFGSKNRALVTAVKEGVDNSLDAAEEARIFPDIVVRIEKNEDYYTISIEDNGPGIPMDSVPSVFGRLLYGSRFHREMQQRGQQGIGISAAVLYSQLTSGNPARVLSKTRESDKANYVEVGIDTDKNNPIIHVQEEREWEEKDHGVRIELDMDANMRARKRLHRYIKNTAVINPHATVELHEPNGELIYDDRPVDELPDEVEEIRPHPHGVELGTLLGMLESTNSRQLKPFLKTEFTRVGDKTALSILNGFRDLTYGRYLEFNITSGEASEDDYIDAVTSSVNRKGKEQTNLFADLVYDELQERGPRVGYGDIVDSVEDAAKQAGERTDKNFGSTVQESCYQPLWEIVSQNMEATVDEIVEEVTVDRKSKDLIDLVSDELADNIRSQGVKTMTEQQLRSIIEDSSDEAVSNYDGGSTFGNTAQDKIFQEMWESLQTVEGDLPSVSDVADDRDVARQLLKGMRQSDAMAPPKKCISPITEEHIEKGLRSRYDARFYAASSRSAKVANGKPFVVEAGIAYGGEVESDGQIMLNRFANRVPLVYQQGACAITKEIKSIRWNNYYKGGDDLTQNSGSIPQGPMVLLVHIASTNVPFTSESKDAVAGVPEMEQEVERAVREVARDLKDHLKEERTKRKRKQKRDVIGGLLSDMTDKIENITEDPIESKKQSQARILNNVFLRSSGKKTVRITNYSGRNHTVEVRIQTSEGERKRKRDVEKGESLSVSVPDEIESFEVENMTDARITLKQPA